MIGMSTINSIRERCRNGDSVSEVARDEGISRDTVRKYRDACDLSPKMPIKQKRASKIDEFAPIIDEWLEEDKRTWYKQRHTGKRVFERLRDEFSADISYTTVQGYVRKKKEEMALAKDQFLDLVWAPGESQADFGEADFYWRGALTRMFYLVLTFPFSNVGFMQLFRGVSAECVCQGLKDIFAFIGGIPQAIVFTMQPASASGWERTYQPPSFSGRLLPTTVSVSDSVIRVLAMKKVRWKTWSVPCAGHFSSHAPNSIISNYSMCAYSIDAGSIQTRFTIERMNLNYSYSCKIDSL